VRFTSSDLTFRRGNAAKALIMVKSSQMHVTIIRWMPYSPSFGSTTAAAVNSAEAAA
jgi:hypothetical protein